jgi:hypothetical protein
MINVTQHRLGYDTRKLSISSGLGGESKCKLVWLLRHIAVQPLAAYK